MSHVISLPSVVAIPLLRVGWVSIDRLVGRCQRACRRIRGLSHITNAYYVVCLLCGVVIRLWPAWSASVTLVESTINITALMISALAPLYPFDVGTGVGLPVDLSQLAINFMISGTAVLIAWYQSLHALPPFASAKHETYFVPRSSSKGILNRLNRTPTDRSHPRVLQPNSP